MAWPRRRSRASDGVVENGHMDRPVFDEGRRQQSGRGSLYKYQQSGGGSLYKYQTAVGDRFTNTHMDSIGVNTMEAAVVPIELGVDLPAIR